MRGGVKRRTKKRKKRIFFGTLPDQTGVLPVRSFPYKVITLSFHWCPLLVFTFFAHCSWHAVYHRCSDGRLMVDMSLFFCSGSLNLFRQHRCYLRPSSPFPPSFITHGHHCMLSACGKSGSCRPPQEHRAPGPGLGLLLVRADCATQLQEVFKLHRNCNAGYTEGTGSG